MTQRYVFRLLRASLGSLAVAAPALGQSAGAWIPTFGPLPGADQGVSALEVLDDGVEPALYVAGSFETVGATVAHNLARFDGTTWSGLGEPASTHLSAIALHDAGSGPVPHVGGSGGGNKIYVAHWNGAAWQAHPGLSGSLSSLHSFDDGSGAALYAAGQINMVYGTPACCVARWNGVTWSAVGDGLDHAALDLAVHDVGQGPQLLVGGEFFQTVKGLGRWDGAMWQPMLTQVGGTVRELWAGDIGVGPSLYVAGSFWSLEGSANYNGLAKLSGGAWMGTGASPVPTTYTGIVGVSAHAALYGVRGFYVARWGADGTFTVTDRVVSGGMSSIAYFGDTLYVGGAFDSTHLEGAPNLARSSDGIHWTALFDGTDGDVLDLIAHDDGSGPALFASGRFGSIGGASAPRLARWDGSTWTALTDVIAQPYAVVGALAEYDDGSGAALYAAGRFAHMGGVIAANVARWDGNAWAPVGAGLTGLTGAEVHDLAVLDVGGGPQLFAAGRFDLQPGLPEDGVARWDGTAWASLGMASTPVRALEAFDSGSGPALYAGTDSRVFVFTGGGWTGVLDGASTVPGRALTVFDGPSGPRLIAAGSTVRAWDGATWTTLAGAPTDVTALATHETDGGEVLLAAGQFGGATRIARWNGVTWSEFAGGAVFHEGDIEVLREATIAGEHALFAGGDYALNTVSGDAHLSRFVFEEAFTSVPGCFGNTEELVATSLALQAGQPAQLAVASAFDTGWSFLSLGIDGTDASGCGVLVPGLGELLLSLSVGPFVIADSPIAGNAASFSFVNPPSHALVGVEFAFQAANVGFLPGPPLAVTNAVVATLAP